MNPMVSDRALWPSIAMFSVAVIIAGCSSNANESEKKSPNSSKIAAASSGAAQGTTRRGGADKKPEKKIEKKIDESPHSLDPAAYAKALAKGRALEHQKKYARAEKALKAALIARPRDPRALSELSWVRFEAGNLDGAKRAAKTSIANGRGNIKAASLYNLGRVLEKQGDGKGAIDAYTKSLAIRPNAIVAARIESLSGVRRGTALETFSAAGPWTREEMCDVFEDKFGVACSDLEGDAIAGKPPFKQMLSTLEAECAIALETDSGWYVAHFDHISTCIAGRYWDTTIEGAAFTVPAADAAAPALAQLDFLEEGRDYVSDDRMDGMETVSLERYRIYCGRGVSGVSCAAVPLATMDMHGKKDWKSIISISPATSGTGYVVTSKRGKKTVKYTLVFR